MTLSGTGQLVAMEWPEPGLRLAYEIIITSPALRAGEVKTRSVEGEGDRVGTQPSPPVAPSPTTTGGAHLMKITKIGTREYRWPRHKPIANGKHTYTHVNFAVVEIETDDGITGVGLGGAGRIERATIEHLTPLLIGEDPINVERLWHKLWVPKLVGRRGLTTRAIAAIDIGLWDIRAKYARLPLYKLLGGFRDRVPTYIAGGYYEEGKGLRELAQEMEANLRMGAKAVKMKIGGVSIAEDVARVRQARARRSVPTSS